MLGTQLSFVLKVKSYANGATNGHTDIMTNPSYRVASTLMKNEESNFGKF